MADVSEGTDHGEHEGQGTPSCCTAWPSAHPAIVSATSKPKRE